MSYDVAIDITYHPKYDVYPLHQRIHILRNKIIRRVRRASKNFVFCAEFGDENGRLHFHGYVIVHDKIKWIKSTLPGLKRDIGHIYIKKIYDMAGRLEYMLKDVDTSVGVINDMDVVRKAFFTQDDKADKIRIKNDKDKSLVADITKWYNR